MHGYIFSRTIPDEKISYTNMKQIFFYITCEKKMSYYPTVAIIRDELRAGRDFNYHSL